MDKMNNNVVLRAKDLLMQMSIDEKIYQLSAQMLLSMDDNYEEKREHRQGNFRNPGHFMHYDKEEPVSAKEVAIRINRDVKLSMDTQPHRIPPIEHGEALHGAQWGMATCFPQPIGMASTFDDELVLEIGKVIGKECAAVGIRQALAPVVNVVRDCRWGRTVETFGEDILLNSNMGAAICYGLQENGVIATPKHYADNYSYGGRDSNASDTSERTMREVFLKPFEKCFKEGGAMSVMASYNSWDGVPCSCNERLLTDILRNEWGFDGFVVSDYSGVGGVCDSHKLVDNHIKAQSLCLKAGLDINLPQSSFDDLKQAYEEGLITEQDINRAVLRVLAAKIKIGLLDNPFVDEDCANALVRCEAHKGVALEAARRSIVLLKNDSVLPLKKQQIKRLAVFGEGADILPVGKNYSGPYRKEWTAEDAKTPLQFLREYLGTQVEIIYVPDECIEEIASKCDAALYFTSIIEGEGLDRSDIRLPSFISKKQEDNGAQIVGKQSFEVKTEQEESIRKMSKLNKNSIVVLLNGSPIDMSSWIDGCKAILEAWYPGEQGAQAICEILFGDICPSGKLPITFPKCVGQLPLFYCHKPSGRWYNYVENDGLPLFPFGYGLSFTSFKIDNYAFTCKENGASVSFDIENAGNYDGAEVVQIYFSGKNCDVVMPVLELKAYRRIELQKGEKKSISIDIPLEAFFYYNRKMIYDMHDGDYTVSARKSCKDVCADFQVQVRDKKIYLLQ